MYFACNPIPENTQNVNLTKFLFVEKLGTKTVIENYDSLKSFVTHFIKYR